MAYDLTLAARIRDALSERPDVREVSMLGGLSFMVSGRLAVAANAQGQLVVRCDPDRVDELLTRPGASWPSMRGRRMSKGWVVVDPSGTCTDAGLARWISEALPSPG